MKNILYFFIAVCLVVATASNSRAAYPYTGSCLPPGDFYIALAFPAASNPVLTAACYNAIARWNQVLIPLGVRLKIHPNPAAASAPRLGVILFNTQTVPFSAAETLTEIYGTVFTRYEDELTGSSNPLTGNSNGNCFAAAQYTKVFHIELNPNLAASASVENEFPSSFESDYGFTYRVILHELGHAIGLEHPDHCGITTLSVVNSRAKEDATDVTSFDISAVTYLYQTHNSQQNDWDKMQEARNIQTLSGRRQRVTDLHQQLNGRAYSRFGAGYNYPYLSCMGWGNPTFYVPAIDGTP